VDPPRPPPNILLRKPPTPAAAARRFVGRPVDPSGLAEVDVLDLRLRLLIDLSWGGT
jgi:hypothetical protein